MLDTNVYDHFLDDDITYKCILRLHKIELVKIYITSVQLNEINAIPDIKKRNRILSLINELSPVQLPVEFAPYGYAYGECYGGMSPDATLNSAKFITSKKHVHDAMIFATASSNKYKIEIIVTNDKKFTNKIKVQCLRTVPIDYTVFKDKISSLTHS